jgi:hypothetical protein
MSAEEVMQDVIPTTAIPDAMASGIVVGLEPPPVDRARKRRPVAIGAPMNITNIVGRLRNSGRLRAAMIIAFVRARIN